MSMSNLYPDKNNLRYIIETKHPTNLCNWFRKPNNNEFVQLVTAFTLGVILSPWSAGLKWFLAFIVIYELVLGYVVRFQMPYWRPLARAGIICASIFGWILGRTAVSRPIR